MPSCSSARAFRARRISAETSTGVTARPRTSKRSVPLSPSANWYGDSRRVSGSAEVFPMNRFTLTMVSRGASAANRRAARPTIGVLPPVYETTLGSSVDPSSTGSARGLPAPLSGSGRTTATSELVVPRSMPTAAVAHASFVRVSPGSAIWRSAISDLRRATLDLVEVARVVAQPGEQLRRPPQLGIAGARLAERPRDLLHRFLSLAPDPFSEPGDRVGPAFHLRLEQLLAVLERLLEEFLRHRAGPRALLAGHLHAAQREQVLGAPHRIAQRPVSVVEQRGLLEREAALAGRGADEAVGVQLAGERAEGLLQRALVQLVPAGQPEDGELVQHPLRRRRRLHLAAGGAQGIRGSARDPAAPADRMDVGHDSDQLKRGLGVKPSNREGLAATALAALLRGQELEAHLLEGVDEVERGAVQVQEALRVHVDLCAALLEEAIARARLIAELDHVGKTGAAAALHSDADAALRTRLRALR